MIQSNIYLDKIGLASLRVKQKMSNKSLSRHAELGILPPTETPSSLSHCVRDQFSSLTFTTSQFTHPYQWLKHIFLLRVDLVSLLDFGARN